jgi:hypothetical protein
MISMIACAGDGEDDKGAVRVTARADLATSELATDDGWAIRLTALKLTLRDVQLGALSLPGPKELDLLASAGSAALYAQGRLASGSYTNASFVLERVRLAGSGSKAGVEKRFDWSFDGPIHYVRCRNQTELPARGEANLEITVQPAALFRSSLVAGQNSTSFQAIADADGDGDGNVIGDELWAQGVAGYELGDQKYLSSLWEFIIAQLAQLGHVDADARCEILAL